MSWAGNNGYVPDDAVWANPFANMKLEEDQPDREPWEIEDLRLLFASSVYTQGHRPKGGAGEAAYWLPLLGLFTGGRRGELAALTTSDINTDHATGIAYLVITEDPELKAKVKTARSRRVVPLHPELLRIGFLELVQSRAAESQNGLLFPLLRRGPKGGYGEAWSKWFGHYIRGIGVCNTNRVFHSLRHNFKDALRQGGAGDEISDALTGHSGGGVGRTYGAKDMLGRFGANRLYEAVASVKYPGLELWSLNAVRREAVSPK